MVYTESFSLHTTSPQKKHPCHRMEAAVLTQCVTIGLNGHAVVLQLDVLMTQKDPGRVVTLVEPNPSLEVDNSFFMVST